MEKMGMAYYNFRTGQYDYLTSTPDDFSDYMVPHAVPYYNLLIEMGSTPSTAALKAMSASIGEKAE